MNHKSACLLNEEIFHQQKISFAEIPNQTKLFVDYQNNSQNLLKFYSSKNKDLTEFSKEVIANYQVDRENLADILTAENEKYDVGSKTLVNINKLREKDCVAVLTGQQAGLFSGASYSIYKALSAIKLADDLSKKGIKAVPIFWIASEDHDFEEISQTYFVDKDDNFANISNQPKQFQDGSPIGFIDLDEHILDSINEFVGNFSKTEFTDQIQELLNKTYQSQESFSVAFGKLLAQIFMDFGLIFVSPLNEDLRRLCTPIYHAAIQNSEAITDSLFQRNSELKTAEYHSQVLVEEDFFPFFYIDEKRKRHSLRFDKNSTKIKTQKAEFEFTKGELLEFAAQNPEKLSPNALMRPIVQDFLFPTICYFGGGAEIAYFAQNSVIYQILHRPITPIRHRSSFTIIQGKNRRTLDKFNLSFTDLFKGKEKILAKIVEKFINPEASKVFDESEEIITTQLDKLNQILITSEPTLSDNLATRQKKILWHLKTLRTKFHQAETLKNEVINRQMESLFTNNLPHNALQERYFNILFFMNIYGENLIKWLYSAVDTDETEHQIIIF